MTQTIYQSLTSFRKRTSGVSILEVLLYISLMSSLVYVGSAIFVEQYKLNLQTKQRYIQDSNASITTGYVDQRLRYIENLGIEDGPNQVRPVSLAGDQIFFTSPDGWCHRMAAVDGINRLLVEDKPEGQCDLLEPTRGPNEEFRNDDLFAFGRSLDNDIVGSEFEAIGPEQPVFTFYDQAGDQIPVDAEANSESSNPVYQNSLLSRIDSVEIRGYVYGKFRGTAVGVDPIEIRRRVYLNN